jgi:hypothetical protein
MKKRTKKTITVETVEVPEPKTVIEQVGDFVTSLTACGHINRQSYNENNDLEDLYCTLPINHEGDHSAELNGKQVHWADAAGKPTRKHA